MRAPVAAAVVMMMIAILGCTGSGAPGHQVRNLPEGFPADFPLHAQFHVGDTARKLEWHSGDYFLVKFVTDLKHRQVRDFFTKELARRGYRKVRESDAPGAQALMRFEKGGRSAEITIGTEGGKNTFLLRLRERKK